MQEIGWDSELTFPNERAEEQINFPLLILTISAKVHYLIVRRVTAWPPEELRQVKRGSPLNANGTGVSKQKDHKQRHDIHIN